MSSKQPSRRPPDDLDSDRYVAIGIEGATIIYDTREQRAWMQADEDTAVDIDSME